MQLAIQAAIALSAIGALTVGTLLYYHKQTASVWVTFATVLFIALGFCLYWQDIILKAQRIPLKIIFLNNTEVHRVKYEGEPIEWNKLITAIIAEPSFPKRLKGFIQSQGFDSFILIDLEKLKIISPPESTSKLNTKTIAMVHKKFMPDLPVDMRAKLIFKQYIEK